VKSQENYFAGKMSSGDYENTISYYDKKIGKIRNSKSRLRIKRVRILKPKEILKHLDIEKGEIEEEIRKIQTSYYLNRNISENKYKLQFKMLNERLAEIEGERTTTDFIESKKKIETEKSMKPVSKKETKVPDYDKKSMQKVGEKQPLLEKRYEFKVKKEWIKSKFKASLSLINKFSRNLMGKMVKRKDERGVMFIDNKFIDLLKEGIKGKDVKGKFIKINLKEKETNKLGEGVSEDE